MGTFSECGSRLCIGSAACLPPAAGNWSLYLLLDHLARCISSGNHGERNLAGATEKGREVTNKEHNTCGRNNYTITDQTAPLGTDTMTHVLSKWLTRARDRGDHWASRMQQKGYLQFKQF